MATPIDRLWPGRTQERPTRLRWALPTESQWDGRQSIDDMWREIADGTRPCVCAFSPEKRRQVRRTIVAMPMHQGARD